MKVLESKRLQLNLVQEKDLEYLLNLRCDINVCAGIIHSPLSMETQNHWFSSLGEKYAFIIFLKETNEYLGTVGFNNIDRTHQRATWYIRLNSSAQGKGYGNEASKILVDYAFRHMNINRLDCDCFTNNLAAAANIKKLGFEQEGILKQYYYHEGKFKDITLFSLLKENYTGTFKSITL